MTYTFLSESFTNTYLAPCSLTHLVVHSPALAFAPFAPHWLSEIQPVQLLSAPMVIAAANNVPAAMVAIRSFISSPSRTAVALDSAQGHCVSLAQAQAGCLERPNVRTARWRDRMSFNKKARDSFESPAWETSPRRNVLLPCCRILTGRSPN